MLRLAAPYEPRGDMGSTDIEAVIESFFHAGSLAFPDEEVERVRAICATTPTVLDVFLERPAILSEFAGHATSIVANFGASQETCARVLFGEAEPVGRLPFDLPSSMAAVEAGRPDVPFDTADPLFGFGHGLRYSAPSGPGRA